MPNPQPRLAVGHSGRTLTFRLDFSWLPVGALLLWWTASTTLPAGLGERPTGFYWLMALVLLIGYLVSVILHELSHMLVARRYGTASDAVLIYPFGGVRDQDTLSGGAEGDFLVALSGPVTSATAAFLLLVLSEAATPGTLPRVLLGHLAALNGVLAAINLLPAYPLDAGRALRAVLWALRGDLGWATSLSSRLGSAFGLASIALGILVILSNGAPVLGIALLLLGFVVRTAAAQTYRQLVTRSSLSGVPVRDFMNENPITVQRALSISSLADDFIYKHHLSMLPVVDGDKLIGYVTARTIKEMPRDEWARQSIGTIVLPFSKDNTVTPETDAVEALDKMTRSGNTRLMVIEQGRLAGVVALQDLAQSLHAAPLPGPDVS